MQLQIVTSKVKNYRNPTTTSERTTRRTISALIFDTNGIDGGCMDSEDTQQSTDGVTQQIYVVGYAHSLFKWAKKMMMVHPL